ncbi:MAG: polyphosphate polymerase domain-containing protein [Saprospiraceae bacterium]|nr:polyphosphate polymerase domain-containing protein [Saprospiraceae bacterium]MCB9323429.1 polyphosphate polymerase domain-containing protein [Lewinellaceae bacterium]
MRYERKYVLENVPLFDIQQMVRLLPVGFREAFPVRRVNNVYFDTVSFSAYQDNIIGIGDRTKFRLRWYGEHFDHLLKPVLEEKVKHGELGYKNVFPLQDTFWKDIAKAAREIPQISNLNLSPVLINSYLRYYYATPDNRFRLTIDLDMKYGRFETSRALLPYAFSEKTVLEIKYDQEFSEEADRITQFFPLRPTKHSKYVIGIQASYG